MVAFLLLLQLRYLLRPLVLNRLLSSISPSRYPENACYAYKEEYPGANQGYTINPLNQE